MANTKETKTEQSGQKTVSKALKVKNPTKSDIRIVGKGGAIAVIKAGEERKLTNAFDSAVREEKALDLV